MPEYPSRFFELAVSQFAKLPGIGKKSAVRMVLHLLRENKEFSQVLGQSIIDLRENVQYCSHCFNISETEVCEICSNYKRDKKTLCVVEDVRDVIAIENTSQYQGVYHVLGGVISPMDGIGPNDLQIQSLINRLASSEVDEVILALPPTIEGDTTNFYIYRKLSGIEVQVTTIARGIAFGNELQYTDEVTLGRSIINRTPYKASVQLK